PGTSTINESVSQISGETLPVNATVSGTDCFTNYQAGAFVSGAYSLSSVVLQSAGTIAWNETDTSSQTFSNTGFESSADTLISSLQEGSVSAASTLTDSGSQS